METGYEFREGVNHPIKGDYPELDSKAAKPLPWLRQAGVLFIVHVFFVCVGISSPVSAMPIVNAEKLGFAHNFGAIDVTDQASKYEAIFRDAGHPPLLFVFNGLGRLGYPHPVAAALNFRVWGGDVPNHAFENGPGEHANDTIFNSYRGDVLNDARRSRPRVYDFVVQNDRLSNRQSDLADFPKNQPRFVRGNEVSAGEINALSGQLSLSTASEPKSESETSNREGGDRGERGRYPVKEIADIESRHVKYVVNGAVFLGGLGFLAYLIMRNKR